MKQFLVVEIYRLMLVAALSLALDSHAQVSIRFLPVLAGQSLNGLFTAELQNSAVSTYSGRIKITVKDIGNKIVVAVSTPVFLLKPGVNSIQALAQQAKIQFGSSATSGFLSQTGRFPENEYEYCFEFTGAFTKAGGEQVFENCFNYTIQPAMALGLIYPAESDELCNKRPSFIWQPLQPAVAGYQYRIQVCELKEKQTPGQALSENIQLIDQPAITGNTMLFGAQFPDLKEGKKYVWQVSAYQADTRLSQSEIWIFRIACNDNRPDSSTSSYRQLSTILNGNYYVALGKLRFSLINPYAPTALEYSITDIANPVTKIKNLPVIKVNTGLNKIDLPLSDVSGMQVNKTYLLKTVNASDHTRYLQFLYKEP